MIDQECNQCYECKVASKSRQEEPIKASTIPNTAWEHIAVDFGGPYPDGHYNFVAVDLRSRYPVVEIVPSTSFKATREALKKIFATYGIPRKIQSDNEPPFNSDEFHRFANEEGFKHHRITPLHPRANGEVEAFMRVINKAEQIATLQRKDKSERGIAIQDTLTAYRSTPHPATGVTPYQAMQKREICTKMDYIPPEKEDDEVEMRINIRDAEYKRKMKERKENSKFRETQLIIWRLRVSEAAEKKQVEHCL